MSNNEALEKLLIEKLEAKKVEENLFRLDLDLEVNILQNLFIRVFEHAIMAYSPICDSEKITPGKILQTFANENTKVFGLKLLNGMYSLSGLFLIQSLVDDETEWEVVMAMPHVALQAKRALGLAK